MPNYRLTWDIAALETQLKAGVAKVTKVLRYGNDFIVVTSSELDESEKNSLDTTMKSWTHLTVKEF